MNTDIKLGGMGGEGYRNYVITPVDPKHEKIWQVVTDSALLLREEAAPGVPCSELARKVHEFQIQEGVATTSTIARATAKASSIRGTSHRSLPSATTPSSKPA